jgi:hypothetical protein
VNDIDLFTFGVLNEAVSRFYKKDKTSNKTPLDFLFKEENYRLGNGHMTSIAGDVKKVLDTAIMAMKQFEKETHFADPKHLSYYEEFFRSMSTEETNDHI